LPQELCADAVEGALDWALHCDRECYAARVRDTIPSFDGAVRLTAYLSSWLGGSRYQDTHGHGHALQAHT